jgi:hypothetical protein
MHSFNDIEFITRWIFYLKKNIIPSKYCNDLLLQNRRIHFFFKDDHSIIHTYYFDLYPKRFVLPSTIILVLFAIVFGLDSDFLESK